MPDPKEVPTVPLAPEDLRRAYADIAYGYHIRLPQLAEQASEAKGHALAAFKVAGEIVAELSALGKRVEEIAVAVGLPPSASKKLPGPASVPDFEPEEVTIAGRKVPVSGGEVKLTVSDVSTLKRAAVVARESWSVLQKAIVAALSAIVLSLLGLLFATVYREARAIVVPGPPIVVPAHPDAGGK